MTNREASANTKAKIASTEVLALCWVKYELSFILSYWNMEGPSLQTFVVNNDWVNKALH